MKLSNRLETALKSDVIKMKVAIGMGVSYSTFIRYLTKTTEKFLTDLGTTALIAETGIPESELFEFEIDVWYACDGEQEKDHRIHKVTAGSIQEAIRVVYSEYQELDEIPFAAYYNDEKYTRTK